MDEPFELPPEEPVEPMPPRTRYALLDANPDQWEVAPTELGPKVTVAQLLTPLTGFKYRGGTWALDNGAYAGFRHDRWEGRLRRQAGHQQTCLFVACPDVVGSARRTLELWRHLSHTIRCLGFPVALVAQDGIDDLDIPWDEVDAVFIGGTDDFKESASARAVASAARILKKWVHVGRVNTPPRLKVWWDLLDSFDGSGISRYTWMRERIREEIEKW